MFMICLVFGNKNLKFDNICSLNSVVKNALLWAQWGFFSVTSGAAFMGDTADTAAWAMTRASLY